jgi:hypothetical protein
MGMANQKCRKQKIERRNEKQNRKLKYGKVK